MKHFDASLASPAFDLLLAIRQQSWDWLHSAAGSTNTAAEVVDDHGAPLLPAASGPTAATLRRLLTTPGTHPLRTAALAAIRWNQPQYLVLDRLQVGCYPLSVGRGVAGAVVLARFGAAAEVSAREAPPVGGVAARAFGVEDDARESDNGRELHPIASWLVRAVEAHLASAPDGDEPAFDRVSALHRLLRDAVQAGSERQVVGAFAEAIAVWDDIEVRGYVEDTHGRFVLDVALPGSDGDTSAPLEPVAAAVDRALTRVSFADAERMGFPAGRDVLVARLTGPASQSWLIVLAGLIAPRQEPRLALYVDLLRETISSVANVGATRTSWAIVQHLLAAGDNVQDAAETALRELSRAVDANAAALVVPPSPGAQGLTVGDIEATQQRPTDRLHQVVVTVDVLDRQPMTLTVRRPEGEPFTRHEQQIVERAAAIIAVWLPGALRRGRASGERRATARHFAEVLERAAARTLQEGLNITVVVIDVADKARPELIHKWVATIRGQLRASDLAGTLSEHEIAVLLSGASSEEAARVIARIRQRLEANQGGEPIPSTLIGLASRNAGAIVDESLIRAARADAARRLLA